MYRLFARLILIATLPALLWGCLSEPRYEPPARGDRAELTVVSDLDKATIYFYRNYADCSDRGLVGAGPAGLRAKTIIPAGSRFAISAFGHRGKLACRFDFDFAAAADHKYLLRLIRAGEQDCGILMTDDTGAQPQNVPLRHRERGGSEMLASSAFCAAAP